LDHSALRIAHQRTAGELQIAVMREDQCLSQDEREGSPLIRPRSLTRRWPARAIVLMVAT
jgi:hypothetical protein